MILLVRDFIAIAHKHGILVFISVVGVINMLK